MFNWLKIFFQTPPPLPPLSPIAQEKVGVLTTPILEDDDLFERGVSDYLEVYSELQPVAHLKNPDGTVYTTDSDDIDSPGGPLSIKQRVRLNQPNLSDMLTMWYVTQGFIGHQLASMVAQHWMVLKVCSMPAEDAIRKGFTVISETGEALDQKAIQSYRIADKKYKLEKNLLEYITMGRIFGIRIVIFKIKGFTKEDYEKPFNEDGVTAGSYEGMVQVDPYWCSPELDQAASASSDTMHFYEPTWWNINGTRYHRTHLSIYRNGFLSDMLKPAYLYGGIPVPQQIMERVYASERIANEAPMLALTKRTTTYKTDLAKAASNWGKLTRTVEKWTKFWTNFGVRIIDNEEEVLVTDTSLADLDSVIMTSYQIVCAAGCVPATKLMGTAPKGFNATGEFDESSYHETLESIQKHKLTPLIERHHLMVRLSEMSDQPRVLTSVQWEPLDTPTAKEYAETQYLKAQTGFQLVQSGAIDQVDERNRIINDRNSGYTGLEPTSREDYDD